MTILKREKNWCRGLVIKVLFIILLGLALNIPPGFGEIFKWVDDKGTVHFTEDPATIPEKYKNQAKSRQTDDDLMSLEEREKTKRLLEKAREKKRFTREEFEALIIDRNREQVIEAIGRPDSTQASSNSNTEYWYYRGGIVYDPLTKTVYSSVQVRFKYLSKIDMPSFWIKGAKDKYPKEDYYAVGISY